MLLATGCNVPHQIVKEANTIMPDRFGSSTDSSNSAHMNWRNYFADPHLIALLDTALNNNQELKIFLQEIQIGKNEISARQGEYLPFVDLRAGAGMEKEGRYTRLGAVDEQLDIRPEHEFPEPYTELKVGLYASWELDVWKKLRTAKKAALTRYLASVEGRSFLITNLVAEVADAYYELMALDNLLAIIEQNIQIQSDALRVVKQLKTGAKVTQLAVNRFEAQLLNTQNLQYTIRQQIVEAESHINFLTGRYPQAVTRSSADFNELKVEAVQAGVPAQLLANRPDIRQAELAIAAAKLDVAVARASFYPSFALSAGVGLESFSPSYLFRPESVLYNLAGDLVAPLINRRALLAAYGNANAQQLQAVIQYEQTLLGAYVDVVNQLAKIDNFTKSYETKAQEVEILRNSITIANNLFNSARADYGEVLLTQREALEAKMELIEIKKHQLNAKVNIYRALGGGWQ